MSNALSNPTQVPLPRRSFLTYLPSLATGAVAGGCTHPNATKNRAEQTRHCLKELSLVANDDSRLSTKDRDKLQAVITKIEQELRAREEQEVYVDVLDGFLTVAGTTEVVSSTIYNQPHDGVTSRDTDAEIQQALDGSRIQRRNMIKDKLIPFCAGITAATSPYVGSWVSSFWSKNSDTFLDKKYEVTRVAIENAKSDLDAIDLNGNKPLLSNPAALRLYSLVATMPLVFGISFKFFHSAVNGQSNRLEVASMARKMLSSGNKVDLPDDSDLIFRSFENYIPDQLRVNGQKFDIKYTQSVATVSKTDSNDDQTKKQLNRSFAVVAEWSNGHLIIRDVKYSDDNGENVIRPEIQDEMFSLPDLLSDSVGNVSIRAIPASSKS